PRTSCTTTGSTNTATPPSRSNSSAPARTCSGAFHTGPSAHDGSDRIIYNDQTGALYYDADGTGGSAAIQFAKLKPGLALTHKDFFVI
ncbi:hypothetical protein AB0L20_31920, partial [Streptomyces albidoflavus]|uniref:hypothetical protein n=1 Tax=Streptomyces albidoflavus TaxID=1886 RepID=UPI003435EDBA